MATRVTVIVVRVENLRPHPNADRLELCDVLGWQMAVPKGAYQNGDKLVYFPPDTLIPATWADAWNVRQYLKGKDKDRVGRIQLRGEASFGLAVRLPPDQDWAVGTNVAEFFGATKWEPPVNPCGGDPDEPHPLFDKYTDIENLRNYPAVLRDGEEVVCTEKIHGTNCRVGLIEGVEMAGSMELRRKRPADEAQLAINTYWFPWTVPGVRELVHAIAARRQAKQVIIFGEVFGGSVQSLDYGLPKGRGLGFRAFDLLVDRQFLEYDEFEAVCCEFGVPIAPVLYRGSFSLATVRAASEGPSTVGGAHVREGVVVRPVRQRTDAQVGRVVMKYLGDAYLLSQASDFKDV
ncbi:MAG: RNA ligase [Lentisphaerae bacterium RIFOXYB12_FULL_65_16]|nr:MAG: RNA ligase [Lentisphaerae bacterium RIFOXYA12_64_32]OGV84009.1 MAG: RNA ligase [Lentisphaerae bacterium RIFOXYB12_FULL_65_16]